MFASLTLSGCLWPTPLHDAPTTGNDNVPPSFVDSSIDPPFGPLSVATVPSTILKLAAVDPNPDPLGNELHARLFLLGSAGPTSRVYAQQEATLNYPPGTDTSSHPLTPLTGSFFPDGGDLCALFPSAGDLFVVLADREFSPDPGKQNTAPGGLTSENHWELDCK